MLLLYAGRDAGATATLASGGGAEMASALWLEELRGLPDDDRAAWVEAHPEAWGLVAPDGFSVVHCLVGRSIADDLLSVLFSHPPLDTVYERLTPAHLAVVLGANECLQLLFAAGANREARLADGSGFWHLLAGAVAEIGEDDAEGIAWTLCHADIDPRTRNHAGQSGAEALLGVPFDNPQTYHILARAVQRAQARGAGR